MRRFLKTERDMPGNCGFIANNGSMLFFHLMHGKSKETSKDSRNRTDGIDNIIAKQIVMPAKKKRIKIKPLKIYEGYSADSVFSSFSDAFPQRQ